ncbi:MAG TPA: hypothetical protein PLM07_02685 [Candidatus Rifleibacterium sp.]|nr:hypothetical protein [Candidatus Rifleibacterium sp.]HPT44790.1 hypothetical protein [Candidatus Rifleibacterium sp.]
MKRFYAVVCILALTGMVTLCGCGGGGSGDSGGGSALNSGICAGFKYQGSEKKNIIFARVNRSGVTGYIENANGAKVSGNLVSNSQANTSEIMMETSTIGTYKLVYFDNSERFEITRDLSWTTIPDFSTVPSPPVWTSSSMLTVNYSSVNAGNASYYLRLFYSYSPDTMYQQTSSSPGGGVISMNINADGAFIPVLVADVIENDQLTGTVRYFFDEVVR